MPELVFLSSLTMLLFSSSRPLFLSSLAPIFAPDALTCLPDEDGALSKPPLPGEVPDCAGEAGACVVIVIAADEGAVTFSFLEVGAGTVGDLVVGEGVVVVGVKGECVVVVSFADAGAGAGAGGSGGAGFVVVVGECVVFSNDAAGVVVGAGVVSTLHCVCPPSERIPSGHKVHAVSESPVPGQPEKPYSVVHDTVHAVHLCVDGFLY